MGRKERNLLGYYPSVFGSSHLAGSTRAFGFDEPQARRDDKIGLNKFTEFVSGRLGWFGRDLARYWL